MNTSEHIEETTPRIVVGVDGSPASYEALRWAVQQARVAGAKLEAWGAYDVPGAVGWSAPAVDAAFASPWGRRRTSSIPMAHCVTLGVGNCGGVHRSDAP
ncbi:universal stress protein [Streptomyces sp. NPDC048623]|uniref:universal stress protein n=1 Tax=Streptomyces sp. NPDC048623 TaxID=3155761 RepID=UPI003444220F